MLSPTDIGLALREAREAQGLTQAQLADLAGVGVRFISELERGKATIELGRALHVLHVVGVDVALSRRGEGS